MLNWFMPKTSNECVLKYVKKTKNDHQVELIKDGCFYKHKAYDLAEQMSKKTMGEDFHPFSKRQGK